MTTRNTQLFVAPGAEDAALAIGPSPWHRGRWVRLPFEHWSLILGFARQLDAAGTETLERLSNVGAQPGLAQSAAELRSAESLLRRLVSLLPSAPRLVDAPTPDIPENYPNEAHAEMCEGVAAVMAAGAETKQPIRSWVE